MRRFGADKLRIQRDDRTFRASWVEHKFDRTRITSAFKITPLWRRTSIQCKLAQAQRYQQLENVEYLAHKGYVPPNGRGWVDHVRNKGNEAIHKLTKMKCDVAKDLR